MELSLHIEYLLRHHSCVIVPGIGAFLRTERPAYYEAETGILHAPQTQISFNSSITASDGLIAHSAARRYSMSFEQASVMVSDAVELYRRALDEEGELTIGHIGTLTVDEESRLLFTPSRRKAPAMTAALSPSDYKGKTAMTADVSGKDCKTGISDSGYINLRIPKVAMKYAAMFAVLIMCGLFVSMPPAADRSVSTEFQAAMMPAPAVAQAPAPAPTAVAAEASPQPSLGEDSDRYYLIVATFATDAECDDFIAQQPDTDGLRVICHGSLCRVACASSDSYDDLRAMLRDPRFKARFSQGWIWTRP